MGGWQGLPDRWALVSFLYFMDSSKPLLQGEREKRGFE